MIIYILFLLIISCSDDNNPVDANDKEKEVISSIQIDSLIKYVEKLSGASEVRINNEMRRITSRVYNHPGNELAATYLENKLKQYGLTPQRQNFNHNKSSLDPSEGVNIYAIQEGKQSDKYYLIGAHYDSWSNTDISPGADDNASGCGAVIEAARILSELDPEYSIIYGFWDEEEIGLVGSINFAIDAANKNMNIAGVINLDMIGWDSNDDGLISLFTGLVPGSADLREAFVQSVEQAELELTISHVEGYMYSDDRAFGNDGDGFRTIGIIEYVNRTGNQYPEADFNDYYHSADDSVDKINIKFFKNTSTAAISTLYKLAFNTN